MSSTAFNLQANAEGSPGPQQPGAPAREHIRWKVNPHTDSADADDTCEPDGEDGEQSLKVPVAGSGGKYESD